MKEKNFNNKSKRTRYDELDTKNYLKKVEKKLLKINIYNNKGKLKFKEYMETHHQKDEILMMANELELNLEHSKEYNKTLIGLLIPLISVFLTFFSSYLLFIGKVDFDLAIKSIELREEYQPINMGALLTYFAIIWGSSYFVLSVLAFFWLFLTPRRNIAYLVVLKTFE
ncbi:hypothetical protein CHH57_24040 [Niallia circulans]|jgi:hypothetical protein|uniref:Uncharacterized protein n=2 Tax=Bacillaceae TaxID=186817 RepID=A0AA91TMY5_NIACI|nr:hypothetical protein [Niallia circulans]PAD80636.1 hypothetical protein CHH57_24040 [Niallia circulans]